MFPACVRTCGKDISCVREGISNQPPHARVLLLLISPTCLVLYVETLQELARALAYALLAGAVNEGRLRFCHVHDGADGLEVRVLPVEDDL